MNVSFIVGCDLCKAYHIIKKVCVSLYDEIYQSFVPFVY